MRKNKKVKGLTLSRLAVIEALLETGPMSRADLAEKMNVPRSAITEVVRDLVSTDLLREVSIVRSSLRKGRPSILLSLNADRGRFVGIDLADAPHVIMLTDMLGAKINQCEIPAAREPQSLVDSICHGLEQLRRSDNRPVLGIGLALSGFVNHDSGVCTYSADLGWNDIPIAGLVTQTIGIPAFIENDANAVATAEKLFGDARELKNFSIITLGRSVGCAHYIHGQLYRGNNGGAGEIGHMMIAMDGLQCRCGKRGCLDTIAGSNAILSAAAAAKLPAKEVQDVEALATKGNLHAIAILRNAGHALGQAIANVIQVTSPELILIADLAGFDSGIFSTSTRQAIENCILPRFISSTRILFHHVEPSFLARGAASIATREFLLEQAAR